MAGAAVSEENDDGHLSDRQTREMLVRLDERLRGLAKEIERSELTNRREVEIAAAELARRLDILNHAHSEAIRVQGTYLPREMYEGDKEAVEARVRKLEALGERMWWPMLFVAALAAGLAAAAVRLLVP